MMTYKFTLEHLEAVIKQWYKENTASEELRGRTDWFQIDITTTYRYKRLVVTDLIHPVSDEKIFESDCIEFMYKRAFEAFPTEVKIWVI